MKSHLSALVVTALVLSGCALNQHEIKNLEINIDTEFSGTIQDVASEPVYLQWDSSRISDNEKYVLKIKFEGLFKGDDYEYNFFETEIENRDLNLSVNKNKNRYQMNQTFSDDYTLFSNFIALQSGANAVVTLSRFSNDKEIQASELIWSRPKRTSAPADPILINYWSYSGDGHYEYEVKDVSTLSFASYPLVSIKKCTGVCEPSGTSDSDFPLTATYGVWSYNVKGSKPVKLERQVGNELGLSNNTQLQLPPPGKPYEEPPLTNPWLRKWRLGDKNLEELAKLAWCSEQGYKNYSRTADECTNK
jgi:hypothetical protein